MESAARRLASLRPMERIMRERLRLEDLRRRLTLAAAQGRRRKSDAVAGFAERLRLLSPQSVLDRGYSITTNADTGEVVRDAATLQAGQRVATRLAQGTVHGVVTRVESP
jgi:exodeoxyribonuclease VII large subunit